MTKLQEHILGIFKKISEVCDNHNIPYYAIGGTMIGAARHSGFIPWDDDIDIAVPIEYYGKLQRILKEELPDNLKLYTCDEVEHYGNVFMKVQDENTSFIEELNMNFKDSYKGVFVDIMPISGIPTQKLKAKVFCVKVILLEKLNYYRRFPPNEMKQSITRFISWFFHFCAYFIPYNAFSDCWIKLMQNNPLCGSQKTGYVWSGSVSQLIFPTSDFQDTVLLDFEDTKMRCPKGWHNYLTAQFGDYMKLPPEDQRVGGHAGIIDLEKSYHYYVKHGIGDIQQ